MSSTNGVPDAWDDDWVAAADKPETQVTQPEPAPKLTKAQKRAQHLEQQRQLWDSAENPDRFHWLETKGVVPLKQEFKPNVKVLSRKPVIAKKDAADGLAKMSLDNDDDDSEEEARKKRESELEERQRKAKLEREEKQRKYAEARERIMGPSKPASPLPASRESSNGRDNRRNKPKVNGTRASQPTSTDHSPTRPASGEKGLFDPDDMGRRLPSREAGSSTPKEDQPMRQPRGPESNARGGFGAAMRGGRAVS